MQNDKKKVLCFVKTYPERNQNGTNSYLKLSTFSVDNLVLFLELEQTIARRESTKDGLVA
jgi:hypothetical protein